MKVRVLRLIGLMSQLVAITAATSALAHHSASGYDLAKTYTSKATIKEFTWGAPHSSGVFVLKDKDKDGNDQELRVATSTPAALTRQGFRVKDFKVGEKVDLTWHPAKSGRPGGIMVNMKLADGRVFKDEEFGLVTETNRKQLSSE